MGPFAIVGDLQTTLRLQLSKWRIANKISFFDFFFIYFMFRSPSVHHWSDIWATSSNRARACWTCSRSHGFESCNFELYSTHDAQLFDGKFSGLLEFFFLSVAENLTKGLRQLDLVTWNILYDPYPDHSSTFVILLLNHDLNYLGCCIFRPVLGCCTPKTLVKIYNTGYGL